MGSPTPSESTMGHRANSDPESTDDSGGLNPEQQQPKRKRQKVRGSMKHLCHEFASTGSCKYGDTCSFAHGRAELKPSFRAPEISAARLLLKQRVTQEEQHQSTAANSAEVRAECAPQRRATLPDVVERYYTEMFWVSPTDPAATPLFQNHDAVQQNGKILVPETEQQPCTDEDQYVNMHKNELCVVGVAHTHSMFGSGRQVVRVRFNHSDAMSAVSGKKKKGAPKLQQCSVLATVTCDDGVLARRLLSQPHQPPDAYIVLHLSRRLQGVSGRSKRLSLGGSSSSTSESWPSPPSSRHIRGRRATWRSWHLGQTS